MSDVLSSRSRQELIRALRRRYQEGSRVDKGRILEELVAVSGYHRKSAIRILSNKSLRDDHATGRGRRRQYDEAARQALIVVWEASDRICSKRLKALLPVLIEALESHGHLRLEPSIRTRLTAMSAATMDRLLCEVKATARGRRPPKRRSAVQRQVPIRTFTDWHEPDPGFMEIDLVAHCGTLVGGSHANTLCLTDVASGWTECVALLVRDGSLVVEAIRGVRNALPFALVGIDVDNGSEFLNDVVLGYCFANGIAVTRSRPYYKNDQAWVEQKNGSVVRRFVGYHRLEGHDAVVVLSRLYAATRLFVNFFQPSFKLKEKVRVGCRVRKRYHDPETPCQRLLSSPMVSEQTKLRLREVAAQLDPLQLLGEIRQMQNHVAQLAQGNQIHIPAETDDDLSGFLAGLATAWHAGEVRPTHAARAKPSRHWRTRHDPFESASSELRRLWDANPDQTGLDLFDALCRAHPGEFHSGQLRTLQRRIRQWRAELTQRLVFGSVVDRQPSIAGNIISEAVR
jgi:hypothetical protein